MAKEQKFSEKSAKLGSLTVVMDFGPPDTYGGGKKRAYHSFSAWP